MSPTSPVPSHASPLLKKCLCQLCSCGCHRCPYHDTRPYEKSEKTCMLSEYMDQYLLHPEAFPRGSFKPKEVYRMAEIPMEGTTTSKRDYKLHNVLPQKPIRPEKHIKTDQRMDLTSTYKQDYNSYLVSQRPPCLPRVMRHIPSTKMDTRTTYEDDYVLWNEPKTDLIRPDNTFHPSEEKFDHRTTAQGDYLYRGPVDTQTCKPLKLAQKNKTPFENITNYRVNYIPHRLEKRYVHQYEKYKVNQVPFDGLTTHKISYKGLASEPAKLAKPQQPEILHDLPFSSTTEFQEKYQAWPLASIYKKKPDVYLPPLEKMDLHTTTQIHYKHPNGKPAKMCQSLAQLKYNAEPFNSSSTMKEDYKPWLCKKLEPITHAPELTFPEKPRDLVTTFQSHYVPHPLTVTKSCKPGWSHPQRHTLLDAKTTYATSYTPKGHVRCLASYKDPPGYVFEGTDADGHNLYRHASNYACKLDTGEERVDAAP